MSDTLLPCPYCGSTKVDFGKNDDVTYSVMCWNGQCCVTGPSDISADAAIAKWNARAVALQPTLAAWRAEVEPWHPLPDAISCAFYLGSETGEAQDAIAYAMRPHDDRTNHKVRHLGRELAQVIDMAYATAMRYGIDLDAELAEWCDVVRSRNPEPVG